MKWTGLATRFKWAALNSIAEITVASYVSTESVCAIGITVLITAVLSMGGGGAGAQDTRSAKTPTELSGGVPFSCYQEIIKKYLLMSFLGAHGAPRYVCRQHKKSHSDVALPLRPILRLR